jgi:hypothetical protein
MKLLKFPIDQNQRIQVNIDRLRRDILMENNVQYVIDLLDICQEYIMTLDEEPISSLSLVNVQSSILLLNNYVRLE